MIIPINILQIYANKQKNSIFANKIYRYGMKFKLLAITSIVCLLFTNCHSDDPEPTKTRTVLVYMIASNLGTNLANNINDMISVATDKNLNGGNLIVFYSTNSSEAELYQIKEGSNGVVTKHHIKDYTNLSAISIDGMNSVIKDVVSLFPSDSYGLILNSHGTSWFPSDYSSRLRSFGEENGNHMEIYDMASAIPDSLFDFIVFDACSMGSIECAYELKNKANYIVACPSETMTAGYPYAKILPYFFENTAALDKVAEGFYNFYLKYTYPYGDISVTKTSGLDNLASACKSIISTAGLSGMYALPLSGVQVLSNLPNAPTPLYDFDDIMSRLATSAQYQTFTSALNATILYKYCTPSVYCSKGGIYSVSKYSGLSVYPLQQNLTQLNEWYKKLQWYKAVYE